MPCQPSLFAVSADKVGFDRRLLDRRLHPRLSARLEGLEQPGHVVGQGAHGGQALPVLQHILGLGAVDDVPVPEETTGIWLNRKYLFSWSRAAAAPARRAETTAAAGFSRRASPAERNSRSMTPVTWPEAAA